MKNLTVGIILIFSIYVNAFEIDGLTYKIDTATELEEITIYSYSEIYFDDYPIVSLGKIDEYRQFESEFCSYHDLTVAFNGGQFPFKHDSSATFFIDGSEKQLVSAGLMIQSNDSFIINDSTVAVLEESEFRVKKLEVNQVGLLPIRLTCKTSSPEKKSFFESLFD